MIRFTRFLYSTLEGISLLALNVAMAGGAYANPVGGKVVGGAASIHNSGKTVNVQQHTDRAVIDWRSFDIKADEVTRFEQPSQHSVALNRVTGGHETQILGKLTANGNVMLVNPDGVFFGQNSRVDVGGLLATTADIDNRNFMQGDLNFTQTGNPNATITNAGTITAKEAGLVGLVAPNVANSGVIHARMGRVHLASGDKVSVDLYGDGLLNVAVSDDMRQQLVNNTGRINAAGGTIALTAAEGRHIVDSLVKVDGELLAPTARAEGGKIIIGAAGDNARSAATTLVSGTVRATGDAPADQGGDITITGKQVALLDKAAVDASGQKAGGSVRVGGDYLGSGYTQRAAQTHIGKDATIKVNGGKGKAIVWSDDHTRFDGTIEAQGGDGFVETSSKNNLQASGTVRAQNGKWLLDPGSITVQSGGATDTSDTDGPLFEAPVGTNAIVTSGAIETALFGSDGTDGADVTIRTGDSGGGSGDITINDDVTYTGAVGRSLTFEAYRHIIMNGYTIESQNAPLNVTLNSRYDGTSTSGYVRMLGGWVRSNGGNVVLAGDVGASGYAVSEAGLTGIVLLGGGIESKGGDITMRGQHGVGANDTKGVFILGNAAISSTTGDISITSQTGSGSNPMPGITLNGSGGITTASGSITIDGTGGSSSSAGASGVQITGTTISSTDTSGTPGAITITGTGGSGTNNDVHGIHLNNGHVTSGLADISLDGTTTDNDSYGVYFANGSSATSSTAGSGSLDITARSDNSTDFYTETGTNIGSGTTLKDITLTVDDVDMNGTTSVQTSGTITIANRSAGRTIGVGTGAGQLNIDDIRLAMLDGAGYVFGTTTSGNLTVDSAYDFTDKNASFLSGATLTLDDALTHTASAGASFFTLQGANGVVLNLPGGAWTLASNRNLYLRTTAAASDFPTTAATTLTTQGTGGIALNSGRDLLINHAFALTASGTGNVVLSAARNIVVDGSLDYSSANAYGLLAHGDITVNDTIQNASTGALILAAGWDGTTGLTTDATQSDFAAIDTAAARGAIGATGNIAGAGVIKADALALDAAQNITAAIDATSVDIGNNSTSTTLTGLVDGDSNQAAADAITGGPGNDGAHTFEGFTIRYLSAPPPPTPVTPEPVIPPPAPVTPAPVTPPTTPEMPPVDGDDSSSQQITLPNTVVHVSQRGVVARQAQYSSMPEALLVVDNSSELEQNGDTGGQSEDMLKQQQSSQQSQRHGGLSGLLRMNERLATFLGYGCTASARVGQIDVNC